MSQTERIDSANDSAVSRRSYLYQAREQLFYYCRHCGKRSELDPCRFELKYQNYFEQLYSDKEPKWSEEEAVTCPSCGRETAYADLRSAHVSEHIHVFLENIVYFDNGDKVKLKVFFNDVTFFNDRIQINPYYYFVVFNVKTGQSYLFEPRHCFTGKRWKKYDKPRIMNISTITGFTEQIPHTFWYRQIKDFIDFLEKKLEEQLGFPPVSFEESFRRVEKYEQRVFDCEVKVSIFNLAAHVRFPLLDWHKTQRLIRHARLNADKYTLKILRSVKSHTPNPIKTILEKSGIEYKRSLARLVGEDMLRISYLHLFSKIKDVNLLRDIVKWMDNAPFVYSDSDQLKKKMNLFLEDAIKAVGEKSIVRKIIRVNDYHCFFDSVTMYQDIKRAFPSYECDFKGSIQEIHDQFVTDYHKAQQKNVPIEYEKKEYELEGEYGGIRFVLPKETADLVTVGAKMHICVGSYAQYVLNRYCRIVVGYKENEPVVCIELANHNRDIVQAKMKYNHYPEGDVYNSVMAWAKDKDLNVETYDLEYFEELNFIEAM